MLAQNQWGEMSAWIDFYTVTLEANSQALSDPKRRASLEDALKRAKAAQKMLPAAMTIADEIAQKEAANHVANQQAVLDAMGKFDIEAYRNISAQWRRIADDLRATGWDMQEDVDFDRMPNGDLKATQKGTDGIQAHWTQSEAQIVLAFFNFVDQQQVTVPDPIEYTKKCLLAQGINAENFHLYADKTAIKNPWAPAGIILPGPGSPDFSPPPSSQGTP